MSLYYSLALANNRTAKQTKWGYGAANLQS